MTRRRLAVAAFGALAAPALVAGYGRTAAAQAPVQAPVQAGTPAATRAQGAASRRLAAVVVDATHHAIADAEVFWLRERDDLAMRTDSTGHFSFGRVAPGSYKLLVRRLGYQPRELTLAAIDSAGTAPEVMLESMPVGFEAIRVVARVNDSQGKLAEFYERRGRPNRLGYFFEEQEFGRFEYLFVSDYLRNVPGVTIRRSDRIGNLVRFRGCQPMVWLDGLRMDNAEADELVLARDIAAMEVYVSPAGTPGQFRDIKNPCGAIVLWKKL